jgi:hypothetical protein
MGSEKKCPACDYEYPAVRQSCPKCAHPTPASVVETHRPEVPNFPEAWALQVWSGSTWNLFTFEVGSFARIAYDERAAAGQTCRFIRIPGEPPCSNESGASSSDTTTATPPRAASAANVANPPAWVLPSILADCKPGDQLFCNDRHGFGQVCLCKHGATDFEWVWSFTANRWCPILGKEYTVDIKWSGPNVDLYTVPTPAQACDGSGRITVRQTAPGVVYHQWKTCPGCSRCKPAKHDDGAFREKVARLCRSALHHDGLDACAETEILAREVLTMLPPASAKT